MTYRWKEPPKSGESIEVSDGVHWIRMPLPFALDHINLWLLDDGDGWILVDTGFDSPDTKEIWGGLFETIFSRYPPKKLICTHHHPDHMGLAGWLANKFDIPLWTTQKEWDAFHQWGRLDQDTLILLMRQFYERGGVSKERQERDLERRQVRWDRKHLETDILNLLKADDSIRAGGKEWVVKIGEGHAPELAALFNAENKILISGDQVLPRISPNVSVLPFDLEADPLKAFMDSLSEFLTLPEDTLVLPSHKLPFTGLHARIKTLLAHHEERLLVTLDACRNGATTSEATHVLFPRVLDEHQYFFAFGETLAHLNFLWHSGVLSREESASGAYVFMTA